MGLGGLHALQGAKRAWAAPGLPLVLSWASAVAGGGRGRRVGVQDGAAGLQ